MLQKWNGLSDPGLEEALNDRISFGKFVGLSFTDTTPDETTFVKFRQGLREARTEETIFQAVVEHIERQGLLVKQSVLTRPPGRRPHSSLGYLPPAMYAASLAGSAVGATALPPARPAACPADPTLELQLS